MLTGAEELVTAIGTIPADEAGPLPEAGSGALPGPVALAERFGPPYHLAEASPVLGSNDTVTDVSAAVIATIGARALDALPASRRTVASQNAIAARLSREELLRNAPELVSDRYTVDVDGYRIHVRVRPAGGRQISNAVSVRSKSMENSRLASDRHRGHGKFADINTNLAYSADKVAGNWPLQMAGHEGYFGLFTVVTGEHSETSASRVMTVRENTIKNSSFVSYLFSYGAHVEVTAEGPDGTVVTLGGAPAGGAAAEPPLPDGIRVLSSRETLRPLDHAASCATRAVHAPAPPATPTAAEAASAREDDAAPPGASTAVLASGVPRATIWRGLVQSFMADVAPPGSYARRLLDASLTMRALKEQVPLALGRDGHEIFFGGPGGGPGGGSPVSVTWWLELYAEDVPVLSDGATWMDLDDRQFRSSGKSIASADAIDIPPGLMLFALQLNWLRLDWLEPFLFFWPTLDAEQSRSGAGMATTKLTGIRYTGERTAVTRLRAVIRLARSDRPGVRPPVPLSAPVFVRALRKDTAQWADLPPLDGDVGSASRPAPALRPPENIAANLGSLTRVTELTDPETGSDDGPGSDDSAGGPHGAGGHGGVDGLYRQAERILWLHHPGFLPEPDGGTGYGQHAPGSWAENKFARANQRQLRQGLKADIIRANIRQAATSEGYTIPVAKVMAHGRGTQWAVVRVRARFGAYAADGTFVPAQPEMSAWLPDSELDAWTSEDQDTIAAQLRIAGLWAGLQAVIGVGQAFKRFRGGALDGVELRPMYHQRLVRTAGAATGFATWGLSGYSIDDLAEFEGPVTLFLSVEASGPPAAPPPVLADGTPVLSFPGNSMPARGVPRRRCGQSMRPRRAPCRPGPSPVQGHHPHRPDRPPGGERERGRRPRHLGSLRPGQDRRGREPDRARPVRPAAGLHRYGG